MTEMLKICNVLIYGSGITFFHQIFRPYLAVFFKTETPPASEGHQLFMHAEISNRKKGHFRGPGSSLLSAIFSLGKNAQK